MLFFYGIAMELKVFFLSNHGFIKFLFTKERYLIIFNLTKFNSMYKLIISVENSCEVKMTAQSF